MLYEPETLDITSFVVMDIETTGLATQPIVIEHPDGAKFTYRHEIIEVFAAHETPSENVPFDQLRTFHRVYETGLPRELVFEGSRWIFDYTGEFGERGALVEDFVRWFPASAAGNWTVAGRNIQDFDFRFLNDTIEGWKEHVRPSGFLDCASFFSGAEHRGKRISLNECVSESGLLRSFGVHSAMSDVWDTIRVIRKQLGVPATQPELTS